MSEENLISLKDAAQLSGYTPDYIGQLIRSGKIPGKQVYTNISWMTTAEAVMNYKNKNKNDSLEQNDNWLIRQKRKLKIEFEIIKLFFKTFKTSLPVLIFLILLSFIIFIYFGILVMNNNSSFIQTPKPNQETENFSF